MINLINHDMWGPWLKTNPYLSNVYVVIWTACLDCIVEPCDVKSRNLPYCEVALRVVLLRVACHLMHCHVSLGIVVYCKAMSRHTLNELMPCYVCAVMCIRAMCCVAAKMRQGNVYRIVISWRLLQYDGMSKYVKSRAVSSRLTYFGTVPWVDVFDINFPHAAWCKPHWGRCSDQKQTCPPAANQTQCPMPQTIPNIAVHGVQTIPKR